MTRTARSVASCPSYVSITQSGGARNGTRRAITTPGGDDYGGRVGCRSGDGCGVAPWAFGRRQGSARDRGAESPITMDRRRRSVGLAFVARSDAPARDGTPSFTAYSFYNLFYSQQQLLEQVKPELPPETFRGEVTVVGVAAEGLRDVFVTPFAEGRMPGAEVHANAIDAWRAGRTLAPLSPGHAALVVVGSGLGRGRGRRRRFSLADRRRGARAGARVSVVQRPAVRGRVVVAAGRAADCGADGLRRRPRLAVLRRGSGETEGEAAVLALRSQGRYDQLLEDPTRADLVVRGAT